MYLFKYFLIEEIVWPFLIVNLIFMGIGAAFNYLFIYTFGLGFIGAPIATAASRGGIFIVSIIVILWKYKHILRKHFPKDLSLRPKVNYVEKFKIYGK